MNIILEVYLQFLHEREWDEPDDPGTVHPDQLRKTISTLDGSAKLAQLRQKHQPNMLNIYIKNILGDYKGRADTLNTYRFRKVGIDDWNTIKKILKKAIKHEKNIKPEDFLKNIITVQNLTGEPLGKEVGPDGTNDSLDAGPMGGGN